MSDNNDAGTRVDQIIRLDSEADRLQEQYDTNRWESARLIFEELESGKTQRQLAEEIGKSHGHVGFMSKTWRELGYLSSQERPPFNEAYNALKAPKRPAQAESDSTELSPAPAPGAEGVTEITPSPSRSGQDWPAEVEDYKPDHPRREPTHTMTAEEKERFGKLAAESKAAHDHFEHTDPLLASNKVILPVLEARSQVSQSRAALDKIEASPEMLAEMREFAEQTLAALTDLISAIDNFGTQSARHLRAV